MPLAHECVGVHGQVWIAEWALLRIVAAPLQAFLPRPRLFARLEPPQAGKLPRNTGCFDRTHQGSPGAVLVSQQTVPERTGTPTLVERQAVLASGVADGLAEVNEIHIGLIGFRAKGDCLTAPTQYGRIQV